MTLFEKICKEANIEITTETVKGREYYTKDAARMNTIVCELIDEDVDYTDEELFERAINRFNELHR